MLFKGGEDHNAYSSDTELPFHQESFFYYLFGVRQADCYASIDIEKEEATLYAPEPNLLYTIFMVIYGKADYEKMYNLKTDSC